MATQVSIFAWKIHGQKACQAAVHGVTKNVKHDWSNKHIQRQLNIWDRNSEKRTVWKYEGGENIGRWMVFKDGCRGCDQLGNEVRKRKFQVTGTLKPEIQGEGIEKETGKVYLRRYWEQEEVTVRKMSQKADFRKRGEWSTVLNEAESRAKWEVRFDYWFGCIKSPGRLTLTTATSVKGWRVKAWLWWTLSEWEAKQWKWSRDVDTNPNMFIKRTKMWGGNWMGRRLAKRIFCCLLIWA